MCKSHAEGGQRCPDSRRLKGLTLTQLYPESAEDRPSVEWKDEPQPQSLWDTYPQAVAAKAVAIIDEARAVEKQTTGDFIQSLPSGVKAHGLQFRMKSPSSLARKLKTKASENAMTLSESGLDSISEKLTDVLRYTALVSQGEALVEAMKSTVDALKARGYQVVSAEHSYVDGNAYKGIHLLVQKGSARAVEIQFHTTESQKVKDENHKDYETERLLDADRSVRAEAHRRMLERSQNLSVPLGLENLKTIGGCVVQTKCYPNRYRTNDNEKTGGGHHD